MKKTLLFATALFLGAYAFVGCDTTQMDITHLTHDELRKRDVKTKDAQALKDLGKIYVKGNFLYINEKNKGIHVIDNTDPTQPKNVRFVEIPGNLDVAMKGEMLYADSYMDLLAIDMKTNKTTRIKDVFKSSFDDMRRQNRFMATGDGNFILRPDMQAVQNNQPNNGGGVSNTGTAGSMARFAIVDKYLYVLDGNEMKVFDITDEANPKEVDKTKMDFTVETIFPYEDKLFIGGTTGMYIYDNTDPVHPKLLSKFEHLVSCDPVVVENDIAYITLRGGTPCRTAVNQLDLVAINDVMKPTLIASYPMHNPHGLSIQGNTLYVCDGNQGLKVYDVSDSKNVQPIAQDPSLRKAYDVITLTDKPLMIVVGRDGIFQYDNTNPASLKKLSTIPVEQVAS